MIKSFENIQKIYKVLLKMAAIKKMKIVIVTIKLVSVKS